MGPPTPATWAGVLASHLLHVLVLTQGQYARAGESGPDTRKDRDKKEGDSFSMYVH